MLWLGIAGTAVAEESPVPPVSMTDDPCTDLTDSTLRDMYCEEDDEQS